MVSRARTGSLAGPVAVGTGARARLRFLVSVGMIPIVGRAVVLANHLHDSFDLYLLEAVTLAEEPSVIEDEHSIIEDEPSTANQVETSALDASSDDGEKTDTRGDEKPDLAARYQSITKRRRQRMPKWAKEILE